MKSSKHDPAVSRKPEENKYLTYQTNKIPWYVHLMWVTFAVAGILYLLLFALSDFLRWW